jgi:hypothetical protein
MSKRKLPDSIIEGMVSTVDISATTEVTNPQSKKAILEVPGQDEMVTPPRRIIPKDSPAYAFVQTSPNPADVKVSNLNSV